MESLIIKRRWECFVRKQDMLLAKKDDSDHDFWKSTMSNSPSNNMLAKCFLTGFCGMKIYIYKKWLAFLLAKVLALITHLKLHLTLAMFEKIKMDLRV